MQILVLVLLMMMFLLMVACEKDNTQAASTPARVNPAATNDDVVADTSPTSTANIAESSTTADPVDIQDPQAELQATNSEPPPSVNQTGQTGNGQSANDGSQQQVAESIKNAPRPANDAAVKDENPDGPQTELPPNPIRAEAENLRSELELVTSQIDAKFEFYDGELLKVAGNVQRTLVPEMDALRKQHGAATEAQNKLSQATPADFETIRTEARAKVDALLEAVETFEDKLRDGLRAMDIVPDW